MPAYRVAWSIRENPISADGTRVPRWISFFPRSFSPRAAATRWNATLCQVSKNVPQTGRPCFDEFLERERRGLVFVGVNLATQGRPFLEMGGFLGVSGKRQVLRSNSPTGRRLSGSHVGVADPVTFTVA